MPNGSPGIVMLRVFPASNGLLPALCAASQRFVESRVPQLTANGAYVSLVAPCGAEVFGSSSATSAQVIEASPRTGMKMREPPAEIFRSVAKAPMVAESRTYFVESTGGAHV